RKKASPKARKAVRKTSAKKTSKKAKKPAARKPVKKAAKKAAAKTGRGKMIVVSGPMRARYSEIISPAALEFLAGLHRKFDKRRKELMQRRADRQRRFDAGELPDFLAETKKIREQGWKIGPVPKDLQDRRVEITGP